MSTKIRTYTYNISDMIDNANEKLAEELAIKGLIKFSKEAVLLEKTVLKINYHRLINGHYIFCTVYKSGSYIYESFEPASSFHYKGYINKIFWEYITIHRIKI